MERATRRRRAAQPPDRHRRVRHARARRCRTSSTGVVDVAQRGRSLGVHLLLATQRPGGVVSENIRANTNLQIALRVNEAAESSDVIGVPDAARISAGAARAARTRARGTASWPSCRRRTSAARRPTLSEARAVVGAAVPVRQPARRRRRLPAGRRRDRPARGSSPHARRRPRRLRTRAAPRRRGCRRSRPCSPSRASRAGVRVDCCRRRSSTSRARSGSARSTLDLEQEGSVLVYGTSGAGKTALLRTLALSLAERSSPAELHLYGLDFATRGLTLLEALPHCGARDRRRGRGANGAAVRAACAQTLERRKLLFARRGVFTLSEYRRAGRTPSRCRGSSSCSTATRASPPPSSASTSASSSTRCRGSSATGARSGVHFAITADRRGAVPERARGDRPGEGRAAHGRRRRVRRARRAAQGRARERSCRPAAASSPAGSSSRSRSHGRPRRRGAGAALAAATARIAATAALRSSRCRRTSRAASLAAPDGAVDARRSGSATPSSSP